MEILSINTAFASSSGCIKYKTLMPHLVTTKNFCEKKKETLTEVTNGRGIFSHRTMARNENIPPQFRLISQSKKITSSKAHVESRQWTKTREITSCL